MKYLVAGAMVGFGYVFIYYGVSMFRNYAPGDTDQTKVAPLSVLMGLPAQNPPKYAKVPFGYKAEK